MTEALENEVDRRSSTHNVVFNLGNFYHTVTATNNKATRVCRAFFATTVRARVFRSGVADIAGFVFEVVVRVAGFIGVGTRG